MAGAIWLDPPVCTPEEREIFRNHVRRREAERERFVGRIARQDWMQCGNCIIMSTDEECFCCRDSELIVDLCVRNNIHCITEHEDIHGWVTKKSCLNMMRNEEVIRGAKRYAHDRSEVWRYLSYSTFTMWLRAETNFCHEDRSQRFVIPACVIKIIRDKYPSEDGVYRGFNPKRGQAPRYPA